MPNFSFERTELDNAYFIKCFSRMDNRGGFVKVFEKDLYIEHGIDFQLNETFLSVSSKNVIRGIHFQIKNPQAKLVYVPQGRVADVIVDLRINSKTYKKWQIFDLNKNNGNAVFVPRGFGHGFVSLEDNTIMIYQCDGKYDDVTDTGIRFDDPDLGIEWPIEDLNNTIHSERDLSLMSLKEYENNPMIL